MNKKRDLMFILIVTFIVIIIWIASGIINTKPSESVSPDLQTALEPLDPTFDQKTLDRISNIQAPIQLPESTLTPSPTPSSTPSPTNPPPQLLIPQFTPEATNSASSSATIP